MSTLTTRQEELLALDWLEVAKEPLTRNRLEIKLVTQTYKLEHVQDGEIQAPYEETQLQDLYEAMRLIQDEGYEFEGHGFTAPTYQNWRTGEYSDSSLFIMGLSPLQFEIFLSFIGEKEHSERLEEFVDTLDILNGTYQPVCKSI